MKLKEISLRRIKPTVGEIDVAAVEQTLQQWQDTWEQDGIVNVFYDGIVGYLLCDARSHLIFYAALVQQRPSIRCTVVDDEPQDALDTVHRNKLHFVTGHMQTEHDQQHSIVQTLTEVMRRRGFKFG